MDRIDAMRLLVRLAERGSFSAAAKDLKIKQSTASKWVAELEAELGMTLVERTTRSLHFSDAGRRFLSASVEILGAFDDLRNELQEQNPEPGGRIRLSLPVVFGRLFVVPKVAEFLKKYPKVEVELSLNDRYVNLVEEGFDLAVRVGIPADTSARGRKLADSRRCLVASPDYVRDHGRPKTPRDLREHQCLIHGEATAASIWRFGQKRGAAVPVTVRGRTAANNSEAILDMARNGLGIALLADWLVEDDLRSKRLVPLLEGFSAPPAPIYALTPPGRYTTATVRALIEHLAATLSPNQPDRANPCKRALPRNPSATLPRPQQANLLRRRACGVK